MPAFITIPNPQPYPPVTIPQLAPGIAAYCFGIRNDYRYGVGVVVPENLTTGPSLEFALPSYAGENGNAPAIEWVVQYPTAPSAVAVNLEGALDALNGPWFQLATSDNADGDAQTVTFGSAKVNFVRTNVISFTDATAFTLTQAVAPVGPYTLSAAANASAGKTVYTGTGLASTNALVGMSFTITGFDLSANNGTWVCTANTTTSLTLANPNGVADTHAGTATCNSTVYDGTITGGGGNAFAGSSFVVAGFDTTANNGTFVCTASSGSELILTNANGANDTHAATATEVGAGPTIVSQVMI